MNPHEGRSDPATESDTAPAVQLAGAQVPMFRGDRGIVPYVAMWSGETLLDPAVVTTDRGIGYADELPTDRDHRGLLWRRATNRPGHGRPHYTLLHPLRQRRAMWRLLGQVCAAPAEHDERGALWLVPDQRRRHTDWPDWPADAHSEQPPLCLRCARMSVRMCPWLRDDHLAIRAHSHVIGATGVLFTVAGHRPATFAAYTDPVRHWLQADQLIRRWTDPTITAL